MTRRIGFDGFLEIENEGESVSVVGITEDGFRLATNICLMIDSGMSVEEVCETLGWERQQFQIFYIVCNRMGIIDAIEQATKEVKANG